MPKYHNMSNIPGVSHNSTSLDPTPLEVNINVIWRQWDCPCFTRIIDEQINIYRCVPHMMWVNVILTVLMYS